MKEKDLIFKQVRQFSPQWEVSFRKKEIARVTERIISQPRYIVSWDSNEQKCRSRAEVIKVLLRIAEKKCKNNSKT